MNNYYKRIVPPIFLSLLKLGSFIFFWYYWSNNHHDEYHNSGQTGTQNLGLVSSGIGLKQVGLSSHGSDTATQK